MITWLNFYFWSAVVVSGSLQALDSQYYFRVHWNGVFAVAAASAVAGYGVSVRARITYGMNELRWHPEVPLLCLAAGYACWLLSIRQMIVCFDDFECIRSSSWIFALHLLPLTALGLWIGYAPNILRLHKPLS